MKTLKSFFFVLSLLLCISMSALAQAPNATITQSTSIIYDDAVTSSNDTITGVWHKIGDYQNVALGIESNDSAKVIVKVDYRAAQGTAYATTTVIAGDTLTTTNDSGAFLPLVLRGYNSSGTYVNRIPAAAWIRATVYRLTGSAASFVLNGRLVLTK